MIRALRSAGRRGSLNAGCSLGALPRRPAKAFRGPFRGSRGLGEQLLLDNSTLGDGAFLIRAVLLNAGDDTVKRRRRAA